MGSLLSSRFSRVGFAPLAAVIVAAYACGGSSGVEIPDADGGVGGDEGGTGDEAGGGDGGGDDGAVPDAGLSCTAPMANCSGRAADGCNVDTSKDDANCGGCGIACNTQCVKGVCPLFLRDAGAPPTVGDFACIAVDATNVYWSTGLAAGSGGSVWKVPVAGGTPTQLVGGQDRPHGIASDGTNVYYANFGTGGANGSGVYKVPIAGGVAPTAIATGQAAPNDVVVVGNVVFWANSGDGTIWKSDKSTPAPTKVGGGAGQGHAVFLRADAANVYYSDPNGNAVQRIPVGGPSPAPMTTAPSPRHLAIDSANAYFVSSGGSGQTAILKIALNVSSAPSAQIIVNQTYAQGVETDGTYVWWANAADTTGTPQPGTGSIHRAKVDGTGAVPLATGQNFPGCIAVDAKSVYWMNEGGGMISKTAK